MAAYTNTVMLADTADVTGFMGEGIDTGFTVTMQDLVGVYTEAYLCNLTQFDAVTNWATINAVYKLMMSEYVARTIAVSALQYFMTGEAGTGFTRIEAEDRINVHLFRIGQIETLLKLAEVQDFMGV